MGKWGWRENSEVVMEFKMTDTGKKGQFGEGLCHAADTTTAATTAATTTATSAAAVHK